jgi:signal transduction histidine kinase
VPPAPPNGNTVVTMTELERGRADADLPPENPRRVLAKDGLHALSERPHAESPGEERTLLALVSSARHELRSPLQSIQGFAELLATESYGNLGDDQRVFVEHIIQGSADLSRALDACFDLLHIELLHLPAEPLCTSLRHLLEEAFGVARANTQMQIDANLQALAEELAVEVDLHDFAKAVAAIVTALTPLVRSALVVTAQPLDGRVEIIFSATGNGADTRSFRPLHELPRRGLSARALLWLRLAGSLLARASARLETNEGYDRVRVSFPMRSGEPRAEA